MVANGRFYLRKGIAEQFAQIVGIAPRIKSDKQIEDLGVRAKLAQFLIGIRHCMGVEFNILSVKILVERAVVKSVVIVTADGGDKDLSSVGTELKELFNPSLAFYRTEEAVLILIK